MDNDDKDLNLAMRLQLRDIDVFEAAQRGRKGKGCPTDYEVALGLMREDIAAELNWTDYRSRNLRNMDAVSEDHLAISETKSEDSESFQNLGSVSMTGGKLSCDSCYENVDKLACTSPCEHGFCRDCARKLILGAIQEEILYPPRCCNHVISRQVISSVLSYEQLQEFNNKAVEYESKQKLYCADPVCSSFISSTDIKDEHGTCTRCHRETHIPCRSLAHPKNMDCPKDTGIQQLLKTAEKERWKRCSKCRRVVELAQGCNHITCLCGHHFCYVCGLRWGTCQCRVWDEQRVQFIERRIAERANRAFENRVAPVPQAPQAARAAAIAPAVGKGPAPRVAPVRPVERARRAPISGSLFGPDATVIPVERARLYGPVAPVRPVALDLPVTNAPITNFAHLFRGPFHRSKNR